MQSRYPNFGWENGVTAGKYSVFQGFAELFADFEAWLGRATGAQVHGHLFARDRAGFAGGQSAINGALPDNARLRDANPKAFLTNLLWNTRGERQCFMLGPEDRTEILWDISRDPNAQISVISGAWAVPLFKSDRDFAEIRARAAALQKAETAMLHTLRNPDVKARIRIWSMAEFIEAPMEPLQVIIDEIGQKTARRLAEAPRLQPLTGFGQFLQNLKNQGMHPYLMGDFPVDSGPRSPDEPIRKPYLVSR
jgi:hypothetical protein